MKAIHIMSLIAATTLLFSCGGDDEPQKPQGEQFKFNVSNSVNVSRMAASSSSTDGVLSDASYDFLLDSGSKELTVTINGIEFTKGSKSNLTLKCSSPTTYEQEADGSYTYKSTTVKTGSSAQSAKMLSVTVDAKNQRFVINFLVTIAGNVYDVYATNKTVISALNDYTDFPDYSVTTETYYEYDFNIDKGSVDLNVHNISFMPGRMPVLEKITIPGVPITGLNFFAINLAAEEIIPLQYINGQPMPMDTRKVTDFTANIDIAKQKHDLIFTCFGLTWKVEESDTYPKLK